MVCPDDNRSSGRASCCVRLVGESPTAVGAGAPRSRLQAWGEIPASERSVKSPQGAMWLLGGEQSRRPNIK